MYFFMEKAIYKYIKYTIFTGIKLKKMRENSYKNFFFKELQLFFDYLLKSIH